MNQEQFHQNWHRVKHYLAVRQYEKAISLAGEMVTAYPESIDSRLLLISGLNGNGSKQQALLVAREILTIDPENGLAWYWISILAPKPREKRVAIEHALTLEPENADFHAGKAWVLIKQMGMQPWIPLREVEKSARRALELNPDHVYARLYLISALRNRRDEARFHCEFVLSRDPENADALRELAQIERLDDYHRNAHTALTQSLQIDPHDKWAQSQLRFEAELARREDRRLEDDLFVSSIYSKIFGSWPEPLALSVFFAGFAFGIFRVGWFLLTLGDWQTLDTVACVVSLCCCFVLQFAIRPYLRFLPKRLLPNMLKRYGK